MPEFDEIRPATDRDIPLIDEFFSVMGGESRGFFNRGDGNRRAMLRCLKEKQENRIYWIALLDGKIAGIVFLWDLDTSVPWLGIAVREELKGKRYGEALISWARDYAIGHGKGGIQLTTHQANIRGQSLYEKMGFERIGTHGSSGEVYYLMRFRD